MSQNPSPDDMLMIWKRGAWLGLVLIAFFVAGAVLAFLLTGITGWEGAFRVFISLFVGPVFGGVGFYVFWLLWRPRISPSEGGSPTEAQADRASEG